MLHENKNAIRLITIGEVCEKIRVKKSWLYERMKNDPDFPKKVKVGGSTRFVEQEVDNWIVKCIDESR
jgi:prophage regulatory protein